MRATFRIASAALALTAAACAPAAKDTAQADFQRDLHLASATTMDLAAPEVNPALLTLETAPAAAPAPAKVVKKAPEASLAVQSETPTVEATPEPEPAPVEESQPVVTAPAPAPVPEESNEPVAVAPRPQPVPAIPARGTGTGDYGRGGGGVWGGVIIRGGGVDGDHCIPRGRRGGVIHTSPIYIPRPLGGNGSAPSTPTIVRRTAIR